MTSKRKLFLSILYEYMTFASFHAAFTILIAAVFSYRSVIYSYLLIIPFYFYSFVRHKIKKILPFIILSMSTFIFAFFIPGFAASAVYFIYNVVILIYSLKVRVKNQNITSGYQIIIIPLVFYSFGAIVNRVFNLNISDTFFLLNPTLVIICFILITHISNIDESLSVLTLSEPQAVKPILKSNNTAILIFILLMMVLAPFSLFLKLDLLASIISKWFLAILRWFFSFIRKFMETGEIIDTVPEEPITDNINDNVFIPPHTETNAFFIFFERFFLYLMYILLISLALFAIGSVIYKFYKKFYAPVADSNDTIEFAKPFYNIKNINLKKIKKLIPDLSKNMRIRRLFYKKVKSYFAKGIKIENDNTARILSKKISQYEDIEELTLLYEKARYYDEDYTRE